MDESHLMAAFCYVALNPVKAKLAPTAAQWRWSSTPAHLRGQNEGLVSVVALLERVDNVTDFLAAGPDSASEAASKKGQTIGRPLMDDQALAELEKRLGRPIRPGKRGRPRTAKDDRSEHKLV